MENIRENASFNSRVLELRNAYLNGDTKTVRLLVDSFKEKRDYYNTVTVDSLSTQAEQVINAMNSSTPLSASEKESLNDEIVRIRQEVSEKKAFVKNEELVDEICAENFNNLLETESDRIKRNRILKSTAVVVGAAIVIALAAKGCSHKNDKRSDNNVVTTSTIVLENGDETISTSDYSIEEETTPIEIIDGYSIDPVIGTNGNNNGTYTNNNTSNGTTGNTNGTSGNTNTAGGTTVNPATPNIPGVDSTSIITIYGDDGRVSEYVWPTAETTINAQMPNVTPTGNDPLPINPSVITQSDDGIDDRPAVIVNPTTPAPSVTPAVPTGNVPGASETVYPTEVNPTVPTDASEPTAPTAAPTDPTAAPTLPDIPTWDLEGQEEVEYDMNGHVVSNTMTLRR